MSTRSGIASGEDYHLYDELMDGGFIWKLIMLKMPV